MPFASLHLHLSKSWSSILQKCSGTILLFWFVVLLIMTTVVWSLSEINEDKKANSTHPEREIDWLTVCVSSLSALFSTLLLSRSSTCLILFLFSSFHFILVGLIYNYFSSSTNRYTAISTTFLIFLINSINNIVSFRVYWKKSRNGPSEAPLNRLLESCVEKSIDIVLLPTITVIGTLCMSLFSNFRDLSNFSLTSSVCLTFSIFFLLSALPAFLINRQKGGSSLSFLCRPLFTLSFVQQFRVILDERMVSFSHFLYKSIHLIIAKLRYAIIGVFTLQFLVVVLYLWLYISSRVTIDEITLIARSHGNITVEMEIHKQTTQLFFILLCVSILLCTLFTSNALLLFICIVPLTNVVAMNCFLMIFLQFSSHQMFPIVLIISFVVAQDANVRYAIAYKASRRFKRVSRTFDALDVILSPISTSTLAVVVYCSCWLIMDGDTTYLIILLTVIWNFLVTLLLTSSLFFVAAPISNGFCCFEKVSPSQLNSEFTENKLNSIHADINSTRRFSSANYAGLYKKRNSTSVTPTVRRASMPVVAILNTKGTTARSWKDCQRRGMSIDVVSMGSGQRVILKREPLLQSQHSLNSVGSEKRQNIEESEHE